MPIDNEFWSELLGAGSLALLALGIFLKLMQRPARPDGVVAFRPRGLSASLGSGIEKALRMKASDPATSYVAPTAGVTVCPHGTPHRWPCEQCDAAVEVVPADFQRSRRETMEWLLILAVLAVLGLLGYLAACAGADRWLTFREWWGGNDGR